MANRFWVGGGSANTWAATGNTNWATTSGGANNASVPTTTDVAIFDSNSGVGNSVIGASITVQGLDCTGGTGNYAGTITHNTGVTLTINTGAASSLRFSAGMTYTPASTSSLIALTHTSGTANITCAGQKLFALTINGAGGTTTLLDILLVNFGLNAILTLTAGILDAGTNTVAITAGLFSSSNSNTRSLILGGTVSIGGNVSGGQNIWNIGTITGLTFTKNSANIIILTPSSSITEVGFVSGGLTYNNLTVNASTTKTVLALSNASNTFANLTVGSGWNLQFGNGVTWTISNAFTLAGTQSLPMLVYSASAVGSSTISVPSGACTLAWGGLQGITGAGGATFTATNTMDFGFNSGWSITAPADATVVAPTAAQIASAVWKDTTSGDFTVAGSIGKDLFIGGVVPGAAGGHFIAGSNAATTVNITGNITGNLSGSIGSYTGNTPQTGDVYARVGAAGAGLTALGDTRIANLDAAVSSRASPTNITAGTITTVTNLTNAPTAGDLTATMKTSVTTAATAATPTAAAVTGAVGSVTGSVGSISGITFPTRFSSLAIDVSGNVTFGNTSIATVTNLTNAPTAGDFTAAMKTSLNAATPVATVSGDFSATMKTSLNAATPAVTVSDKTGFSLASGGLAAVTAWSVAITGNITGNLSGSVGSVTGLTASNLDATISSRLATSGYTVPDNSDIAAIKVKTDNLPASPAAVGSAMTLTSAYDAAKTALAASAYTSPDNADIAAIKIKTDHLPDSDIVNTTGKLWVLDGNGNPVAPASAVAALPTTSTVMAADIKKVNGVTVNGDGSATPWGP